MQKEWNIQEYLENTRDWSDVTPRTELLTRSEMLKKLERMDNSTGRELRGHNVINNARREQR